MAVNQTTTECVLCECEIPPLGGNDYGTGFAHPVCITAARQGKKDKQVMQIRTSGGTFTRNKRGRCIDAPCCG